MQDIMNSFKAHLYDRTSSPIVGSFIFYWLICNYKMVVVLFDNTLNSDAKFKAIELLYKNDFIMYFGFNISITGLVLPIVITLVYILIFPFISNTIYEGWVWHQNKLKEISNGKVLTKKEFGDLQRRFVELELSFDETFSQKDNEIIQLKKIVDEKEQKNINYLSQINDLKEQENLYEESIKSLESKYELDSFEAKKALLENIALKKELNEFRINTTLHFDNNYKDKNIERHLVEVLKYIGENPNNSTTEVAKELQIHRLKLESIYDTLLEKKFIKVNTKYTGGDIEYRIEPEGRDFLLDNDLV